MNGSSLSSTMFRRVVALDKDAWQRVFDLYHPYLYSKCRHRGLHGHDAADVAQEVMMAAFKSIANFRREEPGSSFRAWLLGIADHKLQDHWDGKAINPQGEGGSDTQRWLDQLIAPGDESSRKINADAEKAGLIRRALELIQLEFEERTWKAFWRFAIDTQPAAAVATELGTTPNAVHVAACRVRKRLRDEFGDFL
jgi:RNA polymerase sigma-70 factor, ECF subfamily